MSGSADEARRTVPGGAETGVAAGRDRLLAVAKLARISLPEDAIPGLVEDFRRIVGYFATLSEVDTEGVVETSSVLVSRMPLRPDVPHESLPRDEILESAPRVSGEGFAVPAFADDRPDE